MNPVILIPGVMGTTLVNSNTIDFDIIYSGVQKLYESIYDLGLKLDTEIDELPRAIIERSHVEPLAYKEIVNYLKNQLGCQVYIFGYDWRKSCVYNGDKLKEYIRYLQTKLNITQFNFITHSMGGLILSCCLNKHQNFIDIEHAIITVPPFKGSVEALKSLVEGESWLFNPRDNVRKIARTFPSVYELLPVYNGAVIHENGTQLNINDRNQWQSNLVNDIIFQDRLDKYANPQGSFYDFTKIPVDSKNKFLVIAGSNEETKNKVIIKPTDPDGKIKNFFDFKQLEGNGDGTVPIESASYFKNSLLTIAVESKWFDKTTHPFFLKDGRVQTIIYRFLNNNTIKSDWFEVIGGTVKKVV